MKRVLLIILCIVGLWCACTEEKPGFYRGGGGLCFYPSRTNDSYPYFGDGIDGRDSMTIVSSTKLRDTLYFRLMVYGQKSTKDRYFSLKQSVLSHLDSVSYVNDSTAVAVEGVNFVSFDDPEMQKYYVIHPDSSNVYVPIIMTYDPNTAGERQNFCLYFEIVPNDEISVFDPRFYRAELRMRQTEN